MLLLIRFAVIYFLFATAWNFYMRDDLFFVGAKVLSTGISAFGIMNYFAIALVFFAVWVWTKCETHVEFAKRIAFAFVTLGFCCLFLSAFSAVKTSLPYTAEMWGLEPFFADPFLAEVDRLMHFGTDPWVWTHALTETLGWDNFAVHASIVYGPMWLILAFYLPAIMVFAGEDRRTMNHYVALYAFSWVVLGNVFAMIGQSGGPIYFDNITETARFAELHASLATASMANSWFGAVQPALWQAYVTEDQAIGSGIAAFPSLHLGMIMVVALYLAEKHAVLRAFGVFMVVSVLFISVWVGYHYAIDGYFSIVAIYVAHLALKRWSRAGDDAPAAQNVSQDAVQNA